MRQIFFGLDFERSHIKIGDTYFIAVDSSTYELLTDYSTEVSTSTQAKVYFDGSLYNEEKIDWTVVQTMTIKSFDNKIENTFNIKIVKTPTTEADESDVPFVPVITKEDDPLIYNAYVYNNELETNKYYFTTINGNELKIEVPSNYNLANLNIGFGYNYGVQFNNFVNFSGGQINVSEPVIVYAYNNQGVRKAYTLVVEKTLPAIVQTLSFPKIELSQYYANIGGVFMYNINYSEYSSNFTVTGTSISGYRMSVPLLNTVDLSNLSAYFYGNGDNLISYLGKTYLDYDAINLNLTSPAVLKVFSKAGNSVNYTIVGMPKSLSSLVGISFYTNYAIHKVMQDTEDETTTHLFLNEGYSVNNVPIYFQQSFNNTFLKYKGSYIPFNNYNKGFDATTPIIFTLEAENGRTVTSRVVVHPYNEEDVQVIPNSVSTNPSLHYVEINNSQVFYYQTQSSENPRGYFDNTVIYIRLNKNYTSRRFAPNFNFLYSGTYAVYVNDVLQFNNLSVQDFTNPVTYKFVAEDGTTKSYTIVVAFPSEEFKIIANTLTGVSESLLKEPISDYISVYPNPVVAGTELTVSTGGAVAKSIEIYSLIGSLMYTSFPNSSTSTLQTSLLAKGVYVAKIINDDLSSKSIRFIVN